MNNKSLISVLAERTGRSRTEVASLLEIIAQGVADRLRDGDTLAIQGFGSLEARRRGERKIMNPSTREWMLVPSRCTVVFKTGAVYKEKLKTLKRDGQ